MSETNTVEQPVQLDSKTVGLLKRIATLNVKSKAMTPEPITAPVKTLIDAGLATATAMRCGPLALPAGEVWLRLTPDGEKLIAVDTA